MKRRRFINGLIGISVAPLIIANSKTRTRFIEGISAGDPASDTAVIWAKTNKSAQMFLEWSTTNNFENGFRIAGPHVSKQNGHIGKIALSGLPPGQKIFYRITFGHSRNKISKIGKLQTPHMERDVSFVFGGDQCGAGWGINPDWGGLRIFETMHKTNPDFLIHLGDRIYADTPLQESVYIGNNSYWRNIVTPEKLQPAQTLEEFRGNYSYNFLDRHFRKFSAEVPIMATWDDHEVTNNWWPHRRFSKRLIEHKGYINRDVDFLLQNGRQAFFDFTPMSRFKNDPNRIYRKISYGKLIDVFLLDSRSYRSNNNLETSRKLGEHSALLGNTQVNWLKQSLAHSKATWKVIGNPLPISHTSKNYRRRYDKFGNYGDYEPLHREIEIADVLSHIKNQKIKNVVWLAADVHYSAANHFHADRASFKNFDPFWEFISGPFHTRPGRGVSLDMTFGPERIFRTPRAPKGNLPPSEEYLYFGHGRILKENSDLIITIRNLQGKTLFEKRIAASK